MILLPDVIAHDLGLYLRNHKTLVFSDFHMGMEEALNKQGVLVPRVHTAQLLARLEKLFSSLKEPVEKIVITGDLKHAFGRIRTQEWQDVIKLVDFLMGKCNELVLIKGNHDVTLGPIVKYRGFKLVDEVRLDDVLLIHGDKEPKNLDGVKLVIMGHEHPAISLHSNGRSETYKCFLVGSYKRKKLIVQPSSNLLTEGTDVLKEKVLSPLLKNGIAKFEVFVIDEKRGKVLKFGTVKDWK